MSQVRDASRPTLTAEFFRWNWGVGPSGRGQLARDGYRRTALAALVAGTGPFLPGHKPSGEDERCVIQSRLRAPSTPLRA